MTLATAQPKRRKKDSFRVVFDFGDLFRNDPSRRTEKKCEGHVPGALLPRFTACGSSIARQKGQDDRQEIVTRTAAYGDHPPSPKLGAFRKQRRQKSVTFPGANTGSPSTMKGGRLDCCGILSEGKIACSSTLAENAPVSTKSYRSKRRL